jgi:hypothetical protein
MQGTGWHHFITALVDHEASKKYGIYGTHVPWAAVLPVVCCHTA